MDGPAFSTRAETETHRQLGFDVIGMTNLGEIRLAREAEIAVATMAMITDYDCWKVEEEPVTADAVIAHLRGQRRRREEHPRPRHPAHSRASPDWPEHRALDSALVTDRKLWPAETVEKLGVILERFVRSAEAPRSWLVAPASIPSFHAGTLFAISMTAMIRSPARRLACCRRCRSPAPRPRLPRRRRARASALGSCDGDAAPRRPRPRTRRPEDHLLPVPRRWPVHRDDLRRRPARREYAAPARHAQAAQDQRDLLHGRPMRGGVSPRS